MKPLSKFASVVNKIPELKYLWLKRGIETFDVFHKIEKENYKFTIPERPTNNNFITPIWADKIPITEGSVSAEGIKLKGMMDKEVLSQFGQAKEILGVGEICYYEPVDGEMEYFQLSRLDTIAFDIPNEGAFDIEIVFCEEERKNYNSYKKSILYYTLMSKDNNGLPVVCTNNYRKEFEHEIAVGEEDNEEKGEIIQGKILVKECLVSREESIKETP